MFLLRLWDDIVAQARSAPAGALVHGDLPLSMRILRDLLGTNVERIRIDSPIECARSQEFARTFIPKRSEEHTSELQSLMRISYAVFCLKKKTQKVKQPIHTKTTS